MSKSKIEEGSLINVFLIGLIVIGWFGCDYLSKQFMILPVQELPKPNLTEKIIDIKTLYPVLVEFSKKASTSTSNDPENVDAVFGKKEEEKKLIVAPPVDYVSIVRSSITLDAVSNVGAFINGQFYKRGDVVSVATIQDGTVNIRPVLTSLDRRSVTISIGKKSFILRMQ